MSNMSSSHTPNKKIKSKYSEENLKKALDEVRDNKKSIRQICKDYGIPKTTILDKLSGRRPDGVKKSGPEPALGIEGEKKIVAWLLDISKCGFPVKKNELLDTVQKIVQDGQFKNQFKDDRPGQKWFDKFLARNTEISVKNAEGINKARAHVTEQSIRLWFKELEEYLKSINQTDILSNPERIFNGDESGFALCPKTGKVLGPRGFKNLYQIKPNNEKENITVLLTFNANGDMCPPCVVFPYVRPPKAVVNSMPEGWCLGKSETGWMRGDVFFEYVTNDFNNWVEEKNIKKPVLLLVDGHKSHMSLMLSTICEEMKIILYALPPNTTHILQPADVSVFAPVKTYWKATVREFLSKPENLNSAVTKSNFCTLLNEALKHPNMPENIKNGFKRCGLFPFDANSPDYTKCVRNTLENVQSIGGPTHDINHSDIKTFKKVLKYIRPALKEKKINIRPILREVNNLRKSLPPELGIGEISIETESESSLIDLSNTEENLTNSSHIECELDATTEITFSSSHNEDKNRNDSNDSSPTLQIETVSAEVHTAPIQSVEPDRLINDWSSHE
ncbi:tigger transposable element-derived protein 1-like [Maniola jurtina]|uniref:tigger transposable element-derived protein 1-like n=1 Tax=Maniola jurtina TaxID=191418 RepID=UPI001E68D7DD|nr:tigger transposable element-derived protein 1-like [Maniola jurtina]